MVNFSMSTIEIVESLPNSLVGNHLSKQLIRSGTSPALNYGEAQSAESRNDFIHKMKISLKDLRESSVCLKIISKKYKDQIDVSAVIDECEELISIFVKSIQTAKKNIIRDS